MVKVRAWHKKLKEYVQVSKYAVIDQNGEIGNDDLIIEQFTGLYDKNGVEIFEADEVEYTRRKGRKSSGSKHVVRHTSYWENDPDTRNPQYSGFGISVDHSLTYSFAQVGLQVVGNVHEGEHYE